MTFGTVDLGELMFGETRGSRDGSGSQRLANPAQVPIIAPLAWGSSSAGRAPRSQCGGRGFDPLLLHQSRSCIN